MKKSVLVTWLLALTVLSMNAQQSDFPKLTGAYLGQKPPGRTAEVFARKIVSLAEFIDFKGLYSPDDKEYYCYRHALLKTIPTLLCTKVKKQILGISYSQEKMPEWSKGDPISIGVRVTIRSSVLSQDREILISLPEEYAKSEEYYPVIYFTDGSTKRLSLFRGVVDLLAEANKIPNMILVGIVQLNRNDELTPVGIQDLNPNDPGKSSQQTGDKAPLLRFMEKELIPIIESKYRTLNSRIYLGHSRGGLFGIYCMQTAPEIFDAQIDVDPSLWWKDGAMVNSLETFLKKNPDFENSLYIGETREMHSENGEHFDRLNEVMRKKLNKSFTYGFLELPSTESHESAILPTVYSGLKEIFKDFSEFDYEKMSFEDFQKHYSRPILGAIYHLTEMMINDFAYHKLRLNQYADAIDAFKENTIRFPNSANAFYGLGDAYFRANRLKESLVSLDRAVELARQNKNERLGRYISDRDIVKAMLEKK